METKTPQWKETSKYDCSCEENEKWKMDMVDYVHNPSTWESETGEYLWVYETNLN